MEVLENGFRFFTLHNADGNVAHVEGFYERTQTQAPIRRTQKFEMDFFGRGAGMVLGVQALPRRAPPQAMAAVRRERALAQPRAAVVSRAPTVRVASLAPAAPATRIASLTTAPTDAPATPPGTLALTVGPEFHSPFDEDWIDWDLEPPTFPPPDQPPGGGGGGGGGLFHSSVLIELFILGSDQALQTWLLDEGVGPRFRTVEFEIQGFPTPESPMLRLGWWRMVVTPIGPDPVEIAISAHVRLGDVPIRTTPFTVRLADHLFRVGLEALVPDARVDGSTLRVSIGKEIAEMIGTDQLLGEQDIGPATSHVKLRSLNITSVSGAELHTIARDHYRTRARRLPGFQNANDAQLDALVATMFKSKLLRLSQVQPDFVCIRIQAAFTDASVQVWGFDVASLRGELGEIIIAFDRSLTRLLPFAFLDVDFTLLATIALPIVQLFKKVPSNVNGEIEQFLFDHQQPILEYFRLFVSRAVGLNNTVHEIRLQNKAWQIRHSDDPVIPGPGDVVLPPIDGGTTDGGVIAMMARRGILGDRSVPTPAVEAPAAGAAAVSAATASTLPQGFLPPPEQLARLDQHQCIVVVMMENRSCDHLLGDLMNARPRPANGYDGAPPGIQNAGVAGFLRGVPTVHTRDLHLGTAIPVSPRHDFHPVAFQIGDGTNEGSGSGDMKGFARDLYHRSDSPQLALTVYGEEELPVYYKLADEFCVCDRWFAAHPGPTWPNRFATVMGRIPELDNFENDDPRIGYFKDRNVFDALNGSGVDWRVFESDLSLVRLFDRYRIDDRHVLPIDDPLDGLEATLRKPGPLPRVMFVEPNFADIPPLKTADDDHPPADLANGQAFISRVCDLLWDTGRFRDVLLVITYDEHGGFYDHVPPPGTPKGEQRNFGKLHPDGPTHLGVRVPAFVISPFVSAGKIDRTIFDHCSILKTILVHNRVRIPATTLQSFGQRVNEANDLSAVLDLNSPRQAPVPFVRRATRPPGRFGELVDFANVLELSSTLLTPVGTGPLGNLPTGNLPVESAPADPGTARTPRVIKVTERTVPPADGKAEPRDYHAALARMLKPRRPGSG